MQSHLYPQTERGNMSAYRTGQTPSYRTQGLTARRAAKGKEPLASSSTMGELQKHLPSPPPHSLSSCWCLLLEESNQKPEGKEACLLWSIRFRAGWRKVKNLSRMENKEYPALSTWVTSQHLFLSFVQMRNMCPQHREHTKSHQLLTVLLQSESDTPDSKLQPLHSFPFKIRGSTNSVQSLQN